MPQWEHHREEMESVRSHPDLPNQNLCSQDLQMSYLHRRFGEALTTQKGEWTLNSDNRWLLHKFPCDGIKLILIAFSMAEITNELNI